MTWISVEKQLPADYESVLAWGRLRGCEKANCHEVYRTNGYWTSVRRFSYIDTVTHWMPMPAGPIGNPEADSNRYYSANVSQ